jgi:hypothetical protein
MHRTPSAALCNTDNGTQRTPSCSFQTIDYRKKKNPNFEPHGKVGHFLARSAAYLGALSAKNEQN